MKLSLEEVGRVKNAGINANSLLTLFSGDTSKLPIMEFLAGYQTGTPPRKFHDLWPAMHAYAKKNYQNKRKSSAVHHTFYR